MAGHDAWSDLLRLRVDERPAPCAVFETGPAEAPFGRARRELEPGFHLLIPFLQRARRMPTRSRTLDLPAQRVATHQGLVYHVDANLVYRVTDVRKAMIQVDQIEKGMIVPRRWYHS